MVTTWLHERTSVLRYTNIDCLIVTETVSFWRVYTVYFNVHLCTDLSHYYKVWILRKKCDLGINMCLCRFDVWQETVNDSQ